jgi:hypothetical protein
MYAKKDLSFSALRKILSERFSNLTDTRQREKINHSIHDVFMSGFAMMFFQEPSLLRFQQSLEDDIHNNNLKTLFGVGSIPKDTQMRDIMDEVDSKELEPLFDDFFRPLQRGKHFEQYRVLEKHYIVSVDGSGYFGSDTVCCPGCLTKENKKGEVRYEHQIVQAAIMHPDMRQVIPLAPEEVRNTDGKEKQDCEINAGKRLLHKIRSSHPKLPLIIIADSLYSKQPAIEEIVSLRMRYVLTVKPGDHKKLMEWVNEQRVLKETSRMEVKDRKGRTHIYEWINEVPLNDNKKTIMVNYFEYWLQDKGRTTYHNSWVTDIVTDEKNVEELVRIGRCRWKIENEVFNTLKNQGYYVEHNYGHGKKNLSISFFILNLLAFFMHQIFELTDTLYQQLRKKMGSKKNLWGCLRGVLNVLIFESWEYLLERNLTPSRFL